LGFPATGDKWSRWAPAGRSLQREPARLSRQGNDYLDPRESPCVGRSISEIAEASWRREDAVYLSVFYLVD
jgi:hypothetical protein